MRGAARRAGAGFSLVELLVALAVFAALAAAAYGGLAGVARTRGALAAQQDRFAALTRTVSTLERDLRQAVSRSVRDDAGHPLPALVGGADGVELTRLGYANPRAEPRSHLERVVYALDRGTLRRGRYAVLDRAPGTIAAFTPLAAEVDALRLRYAGCDLAWRERWPPAEPPACDAGAASLDALPRAVEFRITFAGLGEVRRVVELPSSLGARAAGSGVAAPPAGDGR
ncbi:MAG TPA: type II secretion system minor pseudopilin GspJ [Dokdonella sp.]